MNATPHTLVVGGTRGIGRALVRLLAQEGHRVSVIARRVPADNFGPNVSYFTADLLKPATVAERLNEVTSQHGKVNSLVCLQRHKGEGDKWAGEIETSLVATRGLIDALANRFHSPASIVLVSSAASNVIADEQDVGYHVAKAGLNQMARYYAVKLGPLGIRVNTISPGTVLKEENREYYAKQQKLTSTFAQHVPLGRMGTAEEIADVISFLCSSKSSFITGQNLLVDGGISLLSQETLLQKFSR